LPECRLGFCLRTEVAAILTFTWVFVLSQGWCACVDYLLVGDATNDTNHEHHHGGNYDESASHPSGIVREGGRERKRCGVELENRRGA